MIFFVLIGCYFINSRISGKHKGRRFKEIRSLIFIEDWIYEKKNIYK